uniref:Gustatory receptor n=1 Tax=Stomoxys calcitrans TaxID=35570 RepID=A0A1I8NLH5_STOCA
MWHHLKTVKTHCKQIIQFYPVFVGLTSYWHDYRNAEFKRNTISRLLILAVNIIGFLWIINHDTMALVTIIKYDINKVMIYAVWSKFMYIILPPIFAFVQILVCDTQFVNLKKRLQCLELQCRTRIVSCKNVETALRPLRFFKYFLVVFMHLIIGFWESQLFEKWLLLPIFYVNIMSLSSFWLLQYFEVIAKICRLFYYLDKHIRQLTQNLTNVSDDIDDNMEYRMCSEVIWIRQRHFELCRLWQELEAMCNWQLFLKRLVNLVSCGTHFYATMVETRQLGLFNALFYDVADYGPKVLDFFVTDYLCELTKNTFSELELNIRDLNMVNPALQKLSRECEDFSLYLRCRQLISFNSNFVSLNRRTWFGMMAAVVTLSIYLIQSHFIVA